MHSSSSPCLLIRGAVVVAMLPLAYNLGIDGFLLCVLPSVYEYFFIPNYPSDIATVNFARSGTRLLLANTCSISPLDTRADQCLCLHDAYGISFVCHSMQIFRRLVG